MLPWVRSLLSTRYWARGDQQNEWFQSTQACARRDGSRGGSSCCHKGRWVFWGPRCILMGDHHPGRHTVTDSLSDCPETAAWQMPRQRVSVSADVRRKGRAPPQNYGDPGGASRGAAGSAEAVDGPRGCALSAAALSWRGVPPLSCIFPSLPLRSMCWHCCLERGAAGLHRALLFPRLLLGFCAHPDG